MNLHYSQTKDIKAGLGDMVLLPYEFTLLSNRKKQPNRANYGFTTL